MKTIELKHATDQVLIYQHPNPRSVSVQCMEVDRANSYNLDPALESSGQQRWEKVGTENENLVNSVLGKWVHFLHQGQDHLVIPLAGGKRRRLKEILAVSSTLPAAKRQLQSPFM